VYRFIPTQSMRCYLSSPYRTWIHWCMVWRWLAPGSGGYSFKRACSRRVVLHVPCL